MLKGKGLVAIPPVAVAERCKVMGCQHQFVPEDIADGEVHASASFNPLVVLWRGLRKIVFRMLTKCY